MKTQVGIRVGVVGLGHNGTAHIEAHAEVGLSEVGAVCDRNPARLRARLPVPLT